MKQFLLAVGLTLLGVWLFITYDGVAEKIVIGLATLVLAGWGVLVAYRNRYIGGHRE
jgi:hypothetical protein